VLAISGFAIRFIRIVSYANCRPFIKIAFGFTDDVIRRFMMAFKIGQIFVQLCGNSVMLPTFTSSLSNPKQIANA